MGYNNINFAFDFKWLERRFDPVNGNKFCRDMFKYISKIFMAWNPVVELLIVLPDIRYTQNLKNLIPVSQNIDGTKLLGFKNLAPIMASAVM